MKRKILALYLTLALCLSLVPAAAAAEDETYLITLTTADGVVTSGYRESWRWVCTSRVDTGHPSIPLTDHERKTNYVNGPELRRSDEGTASHPATREELIAWAKALDGTPATLTMGEQSWEVTARYTDFSTAEWPDGEKLLDIEFSRNKDGSGYNMPDSDTKTLFRYGWAQAEAARYANALKNLVHADGYIVDQQLEAPSATFVLRHREVAGSTTYPDYELYWVPTTISARGDPTSRLLLPSTAVIDGQTPTDRPPDSIALSDNGSTLTYVYSFDSPLTNGETVCHEAGTYTYTVDAYSGELSVAHHNAAQTPGTQNPQAEELAGKLKALGLFLGNESGNFDLDRAPTRVEALVMLIRALGEEAQAKAAGKTHPFTDVPAWADGYVSWGYAKGYTKGVSATGFGAESAANCQMYLTFLLRALGYTEGSEGDFTYGQPYLLAYDRGILPTCVDFVDFKRADVVEATVAALFALEKGDFQTLHERLEKAGVFTAEQLTALFPENPFGDERRIAAAAEKAMSAFWEDIPTHSSSAVRTYATILMDYGSFPAEDALVLSTMVEQDMVGGRAEVTLTSALNAYYITFSPDGKSSVAEYHALMGTRVKALVGRYNGIFSEEEMQAHAKAKSNLSFPSPIETKSEQFPSYDLAVAELRNGLGHHNEQTFETDDCTIFVFDRGGFMNAPYGMMAAIYKAGSALGEGYRIDLPNVRAGVRVTPADTISFDPEKGTFTYTYFYETSAYDDSIQSYDTRIEPGTTTFTLDTATGKIYREHRDVDYAGAMAHVTRKRIATSGEYSDDREVVQTLEAPDCTVVLTKGKFVNEGDDYILSLVYKPGSALGDGTIKRLLLPSTVYYSGYPWYVPTDRAPDSLELSGGGKTLTYTYHFDEALEDYHETGTYTYTVELATGELKADHTAE